MFCLYGPNLAKGHGDEKLQPSTIELEHFARREAEILFTAKVLIAALADGKRRRLPREFREKLALGAAPHKP